MNGPPVPALQNALLELEEIVVRVRTMAAVSYDISLEDVWEFLDIWAAGGNTEARELLVALKSARAACGGIARVSNWPTAAFGLVAAPID